MGPIKVLVIDSDIAFINELKKYFNNTDINIIYEAFNGIDALNIIHNNSDFDIIVMDIIISNKDGIEVLEEINRLELDKKIIIETSCNSCEMIRKVSELGIDYFLLKPFEYSSLENKILSCFKKKNNMVIDVYRNNIKIALTKLLHELGVPSNVKGYQYIKESIMLVYDNKELENEITKELYPAIARLFSTTVSCVEKSIRHAIDISWNRGNLDVIDDIFGHSIDIEKCKPTNSQFIITIADMLRMDYYKNMEV